MLLLLKSYIKKLMKLIPILIHPLGGKKVEIL